MQTVFLEDYKIYVCENGTFYGIRKKQRPMYKRKGGYYSISCKQNGKNKLMYAHRLVAIAFIPNPQNKPFVNHKDGNPKNNHVNNLEWCTRFENTQDALKRKRENIKNLKYQT